MSVLVPLLPDEEQVERRLAQILKRDSTNVGSSATMDRLTIMLTRSCELRCSYCFVGVREEGFGQDAAGRSEGLALGDISAATLTRAIDLLMMSTRPRLGIQLFGGEPTRRWDRLEPAIRYALEHPAREGRRLEILLTTNGLGFDGDDAKARIDFLAHAGATVELSVDGDARASRFRRGHLVTTDAATERAGALLAKMGAAGVRAFVNATLPPAAADELPERYRWARDVGARALQLNYATGMQWSTERRDAYLLGLQQVLLQHHEEGRPLELLNWNNGADPVPLCGDVMVDVDGAILQMGGVFHEKRFPALRPAYLRGHVDQAQTLGGLRIPLGELWTLTQSALQPDEWEVFASNVRLGAAIDLIVQLTRKRVETAAPHSRS